MSFMPRKINKSPISGKSAQPQISAKLLEALITGPVTKEQFEDIFQNFEKAFIKVTCPQSPYQSKFQKPKVCKIN